MKWKGAVLGVYLRNLLANFTYEILKFLAVSAFLDDSNFNKPPVGTYTHILLYGSGEMMVKSIMESKLISERQSRYPLELISDRVD